MIITVHTSGPQNVGSIRVRVRCTERDCVIEAVRNSIDRRTGLQTLGFYAEGWTHLDGKVESTTYRTNLYRWDAKAAKYMVESELWVRIPTISRK